MSGWIFLACTVLATVGAQLAFKQRYLSQRISHLATAIALFGLAVPCTFMAARDLGIGRVYIGSALSYVLAPLAARYLFHEHLARNQWIALSFIVAGVLVYNL